MTKADIVNNLHELTGLTKKDISIVVNSVFESLRDNILNNVSTKLSGFGNFKVKLRGKRIGRVIASGQSKEIPARYVVSFKPSLKLKERVNE
ncbi:MAG: HU family DNA-binding protein [Deferribacteraceae bacterium]|jgi:integration host factor subunit alpha|nr:HU family DNA-binding protein [Deferribacteraceae bacterium]